MADNILLVSENEEFAKDLKEKLVFLRKNDSVVISNYNDVCRNVEISKCNVVLVHEALLFDETCDLIKNLKANPDLCVIFIANSNNCENIFAAYDCGADDYAYFNAEACEFVVRIVNNIKHNSVKLSALRNNKILEQLNVINESTKIYNNDYCKQVYENYIDENLLNEGVFMALSPADKMNFDVEKFSDTLKSCVRVEDIICHGRGANFYVLLPKTDLNGAIIVLNKIKESFGDFAFSAGICDIADKSFEIFEKEALKALSEANATNSEFIFAEEKTETLDEWLVDEHQKGYKIFRQIFNKKLEKVITPVFYRLQEVWEDKLPCTKIEQYTNQEQCVFNLKNKKLDSSLKIIYPGFAKIIVAIAHEGLDSPENREMHLPLTKITQKGLVEIVEDFINEFKNTVL